ncbi:hypothetical protein DITRI_Ditri08aG0162200 [Diplodiscus trichospermus]
MAQAIKIFSKSLTDTDIKKRMVIPTKTLPSLPDFNGSHAVKIHIMHGTRMWPIVYSIRKTGYYKKPVFSNGWRNFVICNNFNVGDELTLYKVQDEAGSFHYMVQVEKPARASRDLPPPLSLNHEVDETNGTRLTKACNFQYEHEQLLKAADASIKHEEAITELADTAADHAPAVAFVDHVIAKPPCGLFGSNVSDEATGNAVFEPEVQENEMMNKNICMDELPIRSYCKTNEEREIKSFCLAAAGDAYFNSSKGRLSLDLMLGQCTPYAGVVNLDLTLAPPNIDG